MKLQIVTLMLLLGVATTHAYSLCTTDGENGVKYDINGLKASSPYKLQNKNGDTFWLQICGPIKEKVVSDTKVDWDKIGLYIQRNKGSSTNSLKFAADSTKLVAPTSNILIPITAYCIQVIVCMRIEQYNY
jgi:hypothetical protein